MGLGKLFKKVLGGTNPVIGIGLGLLGNKANKDSINAQVDAQNQAAAASEAAKREAIQYLKQETDDVAGFYKKQMESAGEPYDQYRKLGEGLLNDYLQNLRQGPGTFNYQESPGYQFTLNEGLKAVDRSAAARGGLLSGRAVKEATRYAEGVANQDYYNAYDRWYKNFIDTRSGLQSGVMLGLQATEAQQGREDRYAGLYGDTRIQGANSIAGTISGIGDVRSSMYQNLGKLNAEKAQSTGTGFFTKYLNSLMEKKEAQEMLDKYLS